MGDQIKRPLQDLADARLAEEFRGPVKAIEVVCEELGWGDPSQPACCGEAVSVESFLGQPYFGKCKSCGQFALDVTGPEFGVACVHLPSDEYDLNNPACWVTGRTTPTPGGLAEGERT